jgi:hypothetical protein
MRSWCGPMDRQTDRIVCGVAEGGERDSAGAHRQTDALADR